MGDKIFVSAYAIPVMSIALLETPEPTRVSPVVYQMTAEQQSDQLIGVWYAIDRRQDWHRLEVLQSGLMLIQLKSGQTITGRFFGQENNRCSLDLFLQESNREALTIHGSWCLWHEILDFYFFGEYLIFRRG